MRVRWRELFSSKIAEARRWDRWDRVALALAVSVVLCVFALKLKTFYDLGYSEDLFASLQAARSWLEGKGLLRDNWAGNVLAVHTYFLLLPLGFIAKPFGASGLLFVLAASVGVTYFWATRILRLLGVAGPSAVVLAAVVLASPISVFFYQEWYHGFHVEDLAPALCLLLFYFLLQRRLIPSSWHCRLLLLVWQRLYVLSALLVLGILLGSGTWIAGAGKPARCRFNQSAAIVLLLSISAIPLLMAISFSQPPTMYAPHSVDRIYIVKPGTLSSQGALFAFILSNIADWLGSEVVRQWLWVMVVGSFATILLRPNHLLRVFPRPWWHG